ncbi:MAG: S41 family peptidase [Oscillospiraceae bacterium]|nr:S41 family peptidase [Oscillospiraceae bacterium]
MDFERRERIYRTVMTVLFTAFITFIVTLYGTINFYIGDDIEPNKELDRKIGVVRNYIDRLYFGEIDEYTERRMIESAVKGFIEGIGDRYTEFLTAEEHEELMMSVRGDYVGIGIFMSQNREGYVVILAPIDDSPAKEIGLMTGDIILRVDGDEVRGKDLTLVSRRIMGEDGTTVELEILRDEETFTETITRRQIIINSVRAEMLENNIGHIQIMSFDGRSRAEFERHLAELRDRGMQSLIIDVRNNGGGMVDQVLEIADLMVPRDEVLMITENREGQMIRRATTDNILDIDVVLLINGRSASASEILAGALKDNGVATLIGETTYGKGLMQDIRPTREIGGALKITIGEFKTPNGDPINEQGVSPHIEVESVRDSGMDEQLERAIEYLRR